MDTNYKCENNKNPKKRSKSREKSLENILKDNNKIEQVLPWLPKFNKIIRSCAGSRNYEHLERLLFFYTQNILSSVAENTVEFNDKINLIKNHINKMLIFFHMYWLDIKQQNVDYSQYLNKISALLNVYIDMELKTSSHVVEDSSKVAAKILAALYIYLNNSEEHIFRILLRNKHTTKACNHIFMRSFTNLKTKTTSITDVAYIRYLLAFKMWRKMEETNKLKKRIDELALMLLGPRMPKLQDKLLKFVPRPPTQEKNETLWLIESNQFDIKEVHKHFLLFEDKMDNSTGLKCTKTINADQTCSKSQKHQTNSLFRPNNSNGGTSEQKINKCLDGLRPNNTSSNNKSNKNKCLETHLQKSESRSLKPLKKNNSRKIIIIDLTGDDKVKRKKTNLNSESSKVKKDRRNKKHINSSKYSNKLRNSDVKRCSNEDNKHLKRKNRLKPVDIKSSNSTKNCTSVSNDTCMEFIKEDEKQHSYNSCYLKSPILDDQNINELKVSKKSKLKNCVSSNMTIEDITSSCTNSITQNKDVLTSQEESAMETIPLKTCQNNVSDQQNCQFDCKQELPTSTDCAIQKSCSCCNTRLVIMTSLQFITSSLITEIMKQSVCQVNKCPNCCTNVIVAKAQGNLHNTFNDNKNDVKLTRDTKHDCNKYVYLLNPTHDLHPDKCIVSTTFTEDQIADRPAYNQHYDSKYSETIIKEQKERACDSFTLNDRLNFSNVEVDCDMKKFFPKKEETDEMTNNYVDLEHNFVNDIQSETLLGDVFWQPSEQPEINLTGVLNNSEDTCIVSTTFIEDQIMESSMDSQHVNSDNRRKCVYEDTMKERGKSDCDILMSSEHTFDTDFFEVDSKEIMNEVMRTNCINDFEDISDISHFQTLEDLLSNDTTNFLPQEYLS